jgi:RNA polymerase sigma-70 factor (ECF subfamily)
MGRPDMSPAPPAGKDASVDDAALMLAYAAGDAGAFDRLYDRHRVGLYRFVRRQLRDDGAVDEIFQDVWMRVIDNRDRYEPRARFVTWLYTIAHNRIVDHFRASGRADLVPMEDADGEPLDLVDPLATLPDDALERKALAGRLLAALEALPPAQREAFVLQQEGELSVEEIAAVTGVNRETAKSRLRYAMAKLRLELAALKEQFR